MPIGAVGITSIPHNYWGIDWDNVQGGYDYDHFFVVEPRVALEFNMVKFFRIAVGASSRLTNGDVLNYSLDNKVAVDILDGFNVYLKFSCPEATLA